MLDRVKEILVQAENHYGKHNQNIVAIEELSELIKEICKYEREQGDREHLIEEMADVKIVYEALKIRYEITHDELRKEIDKKVDRLSDRLAYAKMKNESKFM